MSVIEPPCFILFVVIRRNQHALRAASPRTSTPMLLTLLHACSFRLESEASCLALRYAESGITEATVTITPAQIVSACIKRLSVANP